MYYFRKIWFTFLSISRHVRCPICGWTGDVFKDYDCGHGNIYKQAECPVCLSHPRHRLVYFYLQRLFATTNIIRILHFAPEDSLSRYLQSQKGVNYLSVDLDPTLAMQKEDIERLSLHNAQYDLVLCLCVLEHVSDDKSALKELFRVMRSGGICALDTPINYSNATTLEDPSIISSRARSLHYWQEDHVRLYGRDFPKKVSKVGFKVSRLSAEDFGDKSVAAQYGLPDYPIYIAQKP